MTDANRKGARAERELVRAFNNLDGREAVRMAASHGSEAVMPDVYVGRIEEDLNPLAIELKRSGSNVVYVKDYELERLNRFCRLYNAEPRVCGRWDGDTTFYYVHPDVLPVTDSGHLSLRRNEARFEGGEWRTINDG